MSATIAVLPGDGVGPEVTAQAVACLAKLSDVFGLDLRFVEHDFGGVAIDRHGDPLPETTRAAALAADAVLLGAVGGRKWDAAPRTPEAGLLALRRALGVYANLRPVRVVPGTEARSPLRADLVAGADILVVRELIGGIYFGEHRLGETDASDLCTYTRAEIERVARVAFEAARTRRRHVTSVDKANVLSTSKLWRRVVSEIAADYPDVTLDHMLVDATAMAVITRPTRFDVILTENLFGDILSDELSVIAGSIGLLASASYGGDGPALFEPIHGSAPDIAGQDRANPAGAIESGAMLLDRLGPAPAATALRLALGAALARDPTADCGGTAGCAAFGAAVREAIAAPTRHVEGPVA